MLYLDTSLLVTFLTAEERTDDVSQWLKSGDPGAMAISNWVVAEFSAALSRKLRDNKITVSERANSLGKFSNLAAQSFVRYPVEIAICLLPLVFLIARKRGCALVTRFISQSRSKTAPGSARSIRAWQRPASNWASQPS